MKEVQKATGDTANSMSDLTDIAKDTNNSLKDTNGAADQAAKGIKAMGLMEAGQKMMEFGSKVADTAKKILGLTEETKEFYKLQGVLKGSAAQNGYDTKFANDMAKEVYSYTGDEMMATNAFSNLAGLKLDPKEMQGLLDASIGAAVTAYGDSIPLESLTESINETAHVSKVTGNLADALNWAKISEDGFNKKLQACKSTQERAALIQDTLNKAYGKAKKEYDKATESMRAYEDSVWDTRKANAELGNAVAPINKAINEVKSTIADALKPVIEDIIQKIQPVIDKVKEFIQNNPELVTAIIGIVTVLGILAGVIGPILIAGGLLVTVFGAISAPVLIVIGVITALIAIGIALWANWDTICQKATQLKDWVIGKWNELKDAVINAATILKDWVVNKWNELCTTLAPIVEFIKALVIRKWTEMKARITFVLNVIKGVVIVAWNTIKTTISTVLNTIKTVVTNGWNAIKNAVKTAMNAIKNTAVNAFNNVKEKISGVISDIKGAWEGLRDTITNNPIVATVRKVTESLTGTEPGRPRAMGQRTIPYDNFPIRAHQGEMLLSARDARQYKQGKSNSPQIVNNFYGMTIREEADVEKVTAGIVRKINEQRIITNG